MRKPQAKNAVPQKLSRCFAKRVSGEQRDLRAVSVKSRIEVKLPKIGGKMSGVGCAERTPSEARSADDLYIGVRSALIYQKSADFRVKVNKI